MSETKFHIHTEPQSKLHLYMLFFKFLDSRREDKSFSTEQFYNYRLIYV
jgi:hypothetical protein